AVLDEQPLVDPPHAVHEGGATRQRPGLGADRLPGDALDRQIDAPGRLLTELHRAVVLGRPGIQPELVGRHRSRQSRGGPGQPRSGPDRGVVRSSPPTQNTEMRTCSFLSSTWTRSVNRALQSEAANAPMETCP